MESDQVSSGVALALLQVVVGDQPAVHGTLVETFRCQKHHLQPRYDSQSTSLLQNASQIKLQPPNEIAKRNMKITRNRVKPSFLGIFMGGSRVQVIQK